MVLSIKQWHFIGFMPERGGIRLKLKQRQTLDPSNHYRGKKSVFDNHAFKRISECASLAIA